MGVCERGNPDNDQCHRNYKNRKYVPQSKGFMLSVHANDIYQFSDFEAQS